MHRFVQISVVLAWAVSGGFGFLIKRDPVSIAVPLNGDLSNSGAHYDPVTWTLWNPVFNQTTWEAQPYVHYYHGRLTLGVKWVYRPQNPGGGNGILAGIGRYCKYREWKQWMAIV